ncbi:MAG: hypothetical protein ACO295_08565 [Sediminibacterium sp.]
MNINRYYKVTFDYKGVEYSFVEDILKDCTITKIHEVLKENGVEYKDGSCITPRAVPVELEAAK